MEDGRRSVRTRNSIVDREMDYAWGACTKRGIQLGISFSHMLRPQGKAHGKLRHLVSQMS
jgi:hypothetical protein